MAVASSAAMHAEMCSLTLCAIEANNVRTCGVVYGLSQQGKRPGDRKRWAASRRFTLQGATVVVEYDGTVASGSQPRWCCIFVGGHLAQFMLHVCLEPAAMPRGCSATNGGCRQLRIDTLCQRVRQKPRSRWPRLFVTTGASTRPTKNAGADSAEGPIWELLMRNRIYRTSATRSTAKRPRPCILLRASHHHSLLNRRFGRRPFMESLLHVTRRPLLRFMAWTFLLWHGHYKHDSYVSMLQLRTLNMQCALSNVYIWSKYMEGLRRPVAQESNPAK
ncbi:hypothetical protein THASP1DRAFT_26098 [Thamnocephalis sphaerospora]|uniref:Uncharacterized protein n=1 Tax=Thamnocephalis sphaerospora TaxID=78915 RepID=A0A4P9XI92_9FUNG|nr:hypothetical protein THASP1DRAFT_26098 [Thamnocephalis sphaerospora]|eukprot:RKP05397.1 hypothetical protein THASP1DRAFT_26098 [Thamnocephalis sphaerospora]